MGPPKIILDTNVLISALRYGGTPYKVFSRILSGDFALFISEKQFTELQRVINYPKLSVFEHERRWFLSILERTAHVVQTSQQIDCPSIDAADRMLLETAVAYDVPYIVTGDKALLKLGRFHGTHILSPATFLELCTQFDATYINRNE